MKHRLFFYGTLVPVLTMFGIMYVQYMEDRQTVFDTHKHSNRQIELLTITHRSKIDDQSMRHMAITHKLNELVTHYSKVIEDIRHEGK